MTGKTYSLRLIINMYEVSAGTIILDARKRGILAVVGRNHSGRKNSLCNVGDHRIGHFAIHASHRIGFLWNIALNQQSPEKRESIPPQSWRSRLSSEVVAFGALKVPCLAFEGLVK